MQVTNCSAGGLRSTAKHVYNSCGIQGFWRGNGLNVIKSSPEFAIKFSVYDYVKRQLKTFRGDGGHLNNRDRFGAGAVAGVISHTFLYPIEASISTDSMDWKRIGRRVVVVGYIFLL